MRMRLMERRALNPLTPKQGKVGEQRTFLCLTD